MKTSVIQQLVIVDGNVCLRTSCRIKGLTQAEDREFTEGMSLPNQMTGGELMHIMHVNRAKLARSVGEQIVGVDLDH